MTHRFFPLPLFAVSALAALPASAQSITETNTIFLVDESGSMGGEHAFIDDFVLDVDPALALNGITTRRYGLIGFGSGVGTGPGQIREFTVGGGQLGTAAEFATATFGLLTSGSFEDGYAAIDYALQNFTLPSGSTTFVLITDEDRDVGVASLTANSIETALTSASINLVTILDVDIEDASNNTAISTDGTTALVQSGTTFSSQPLGQITSTEGTTIVDYSDLALATPNGCVADLNQLRLGGDAATAFAAAFQTCIINAATNPTITALLTNPYRDIGIFAGLSLRQQLRAVAYWMGYDGPSNPGAVSQDADGISEDMLGVEGLRGYVLASGDTGSVDANGANAAVDYSGGGLTFGADLTVATDGDGGLARVGVALGFRSADATTATASVDSDATILQTYGIYRTARGLQISGDMQFGRIDNDFANTGGVTGSGKSDLFSLSVEAGQRYALQQGVIMPYVGLQRDRFELSGFTDSNGGLVNGYTETVTFAKIGVRFETQTITDAGALDVAFDLSANDPISGEITSTDAATAASLEVTDETRVDLSVNLGLTMENGGRLYMQLSGSTSETSRSGSLGLGYQMRF